MFKREFKQFISSLLNGEKMQRNKNSPKKNLRITILFIVILLISEIILLTLFMEKVSAISIEPSQEQIIRFGITLPYLTGDYVGLVNQINAKAVLDWRTDDKNEWAEHNIDYLHVIRVSDAAYNNGTILDTLPDLIQSNLGEVWIIGNEPDRDIQDGVTPEVYAQRYYEIAIRIRHLDPTAKIGFGSVVQPTPIRIRYLERALNYLTYLSCGNRQAALDLIDIWSIHAFILNEELNNWGAGIPVGLEDNVTDAFLISIDNISDTYSIDIFKEWIINFRQWLFDISEQDKPLWITEYGSLLPPIDPPGGPNYINVSDQITAQYMIDSFDYLLYASDPITGYAPDGYHLVQRWFWYSLNDYRYNFGGTLFDPENYFNPTFVGIKYMDYTNIIILNPITGIFPFIFRETEPIYSVIYNSSVDSFNYPYKSCYRTELPLVFK